MALTVRDIMDSRWLTVHPEDRIETVVRKLHEHELPGIPVVNYGDRCIGIITDTDLVIRIERRFSFSS